MERSEMLAGEVEPAAVAVAARLRSSVVEVRTPTGHGAGTIWRPEGLVVTNHHVVPMDWAEVRLAGGHRYTARTVGRDRRNDLAVLRVEAANLPAVTTRDARSLRTGELVLALGHPFGMRHALSIGVVSAALPDAAALPPTARELVRADVLLGPGNSGGPLADAWGRVVGINAMIAGGLALAVPSHLVEQLVSRVNGRPAIGLGLLDVRRPEGSAVLVVSLRPGSAASRSGLRVGDLLVSVNDAAVAAASEAAGLLGAAPAGPLRLGVERGGQRLELNLVIEGSLGRAA